MDWFIVRWTQNIVSQTLGVDVVVPRSVHVSKAVALRPFLFDYLCSPTGLRLRRSYVRRHDRVLVSNRCNGESGEQPATIRQYHDSIAESARRVWLCHRSCFSTASICRADWPDGTVGGDEQVIRDRKARANHCYHEPAGTD